MKTLIVLLAALASSCVFRAQTAQVPQTPCPEPAPLTARECIELIEVGPGDSRYVELFEACLELDKQ